MGFVHIATPCVEETTPTTKCRFKHGGYVVAAGLVAWFSWSLQGLSPVTRYTIEMPRDAPSMNATASPAVTTTVRLNVGGTHLETTWETLLKCDDSFFHELRETAALPDGSFFVDWSAAHMERVLMFLRSGYLNRHGLAWYEDDELSRTLRFLKIDPESNQCPFTKALEEPKEAKAQFLPDDYDGEGVPMTSTPHVCSYGVPGCDGYLMPEPAPRPTPKNRAKGKKAKGHSKWRD
ncbi:hypothetical protein SDRG_10887 [Saprolegnia diclina VS20]|uniref:Potassium channel tetramerisation-type BTB domain-containing protein n=1 Tax=Saprolegnia diclina (strain VS20) TaxID=1156394 RepID=T0Q0A6_SAPDV|nr:hypothetical protein SDRG_10887 [Saprolegnia diclina VS20]EQC31284.1 hypothetical protein SDRG_10887 [Saprolegnia diclina VS20]|eukprot:XP_008615125.1 hypothetical protein SDRG_10887 [Saprolegnia diclina VS20]